MKSKTRTKALSWLLSLALLLSLIPAMNLTALAEESPKVTLELYEFGIPSSNTTGLNSYSNGTYSINLYSGNNSYKFTSYLLLGKQNAYLELPAFNFDVEKIVFTGNSGASVNVQFNVFVGDDEASTAVTGSQETQTFEIKSGYQSAGKVYKLKVLNGYNVQFKKIEIYEKSSNTVTDTTTVEITGKDAYIDNDGLGYLRFISTIETDAAVSSFGTWIVPANYLTDGYDSAAKLEESDSDENVSEFTADILRIPSDHLSTLFYAKSFVTTELGTKWSDVDTATVNGYKNGTSK